MEEFSLLAADDRPDNLFVLRELISQHFPECRLTTTGSAEEGLLLAAEQAFDGAIIDVQMPGINGIEMCQRLKASEHSQHMPVLLITAHGSTAEHRARGLDAGADDFISRPIDNIELVAKIRVMLRIRLAEQRLRALNADLDVQISQKAEALRENEERYTKLFDQARDGIALADAETGLFVDCNIEFSKLVGREKSDLIGQPQRIVHPPDGRESQFSETFKKHLAESEGRVLQSQVICKDGTVRDVAIKANLIDIQGQRLLQGIFRDITETKETDAALRLERLRLQALVDLNEVHSEDADTIADFALEKAIELTISQIGFLGFMNDDESIMSIHAWSQTAMDECAINNKPIAFPISKAGLWGEAIRERRPTIVNEYQQDAIGKRGVPPGHVPIQRYLGVPVFDGQRIVAVAAVANKETVYDEGDIRQLTLLMNGMWSCIQRIRTNQELLKAKETAEMASQAKSSFLANMSHEIRTPLTAIMGFTDLLMKLDFSAGERDEHLRTIHGNADHLLKIISDILDLSKIESEKAELEKISCSITEIVEQTLSAAQMGLEQKNINLDVQYRRPLPAMICTDAVRLRQILLNLLGNAIKYTESGRVQIAVSAKPEEDGHQVIQFEVTDTGIGMTPEEIDLLFQPFFQADMSFSRRYGGAGLGLAISQKLAHLLGGKIEVESEPGCGSTFTLTIGVDLPVHVEDCGSHVAESSQGIEASLNDRPTLSGRVLLVEDDVNMQAMVSLFLGRCGEIEVDIAENGRVACEKAVVESASQEPYDLILMDIRMPELDGREATRRIRNDGWQGPIVALTAQAMAGDREKCMEAGCDEYLTKPTSPETLFRIIARYLTTATTAGPS